MNKKTIIPSLVIVSTFALLSLSNAREVLLKDRIESGFLGAGYNVDKDQIVSSCLNNNEIKSNIVVDANPRATSTIEMFKEVRDVKRLLDLDIKGKGSIKKFFKGEGEYGLYQNLSASKHSINFVVKIDAQTKEKRLNLNNVNFFDPSLKDDLLNNKIDSFLESCGHEVIAKMTYGARLYSVLTVEFSQEKDKNDFLADGNISVGKFDFDGSLKKVLKKYSSKIQTKLYFFHHGGNPKELYKRLFLSGEQNDEGKLALVECSMGEITKCYDLIHSIARAKKDLLDSLYSDDGSKSYEVPLVAFTEDYKTKGLVGGVNIPAELDRPEIKFAKGQLVKKIFGYGKYLTKVKNLLNPSLNLLSNNQRREFTTLRQEFDKGMDHLKGKINTCFSDMGLCSDSETYQDLSPKQESRLDIDEHRMSFEQLCHSYMNGRLIDIAQHNLSEIDRLDVSDSVEYLLKYVEGTIAYDDLHAELRTEFYHASLAGDLQKVCKVTAKYLDEVEKIDFEKFHGCDEGKFVERGLFSLMPLAYLTHLRELNLSKQPVVKEGIFGFNHDYEMLKRVNNNWIVGTVKFSTPFLRLKKLNISQTELNKSDFENIGRRLRIKE